MYGNDANTWGIRAEYEVDNMMDKADHERIYVGNPKGSEGDMMCCDDSWERERLASRGLEKFDPHSEPGCDVKPMYPDQVTYKGYGDKYRG